MHKLLDTPNPLILGSDLQVGRSAHPVSASRDRPGASFTDSNEERGVRVLLCPGPRFVGAIAARFARSAYHLCRCRCAIVLDLSEVATMDAAGLLTITSLLRACQSAGGTPRLCSPNPAVRRLLASAGMHQLVDIYPTRRHASLD